MRLSTTLLDNLMTVAIEQAWEANKQGEVPIGAVIANSNGDILSTGHNEIESKQDPTAHAELLAIQRAAQRRNNWRLSDTILCVTLEPCAMCTSGIKLARIPVVVFGATDNKLGACGSLFDLTEDSRLGPIPRVISGIKKEQCTQLLQTFFQSARSRRKRWIHCNQ